MGKGNKVVIFGINDLAELAHFYFLHENIKSEGEIIPVAFSVSREYFRENEFKGLPVVPFEELENHYPPEDYKLFAPVTDNKLRERFGKTNSHIVHFR